MKIYKYPLKFDPIQELNLPLNAKILSVQMQGKIPTLWAMVDETQNLEVRKIRMLHTGTTCIGCNKYLATLQLREDWIAHVFEE